MEDEANWREPLWSTVLFPTSTFLPDGRHFNLRLMDTNIQFRDRYLLRFNQFLYLGGAIPNAGIKLKLSNKFRSIYYPTFHYSYFDFSVLRRMFLALEGTGIIIIAAIFGIDGDIDFNDVKSLIHQFGFSYIKPLTQQFNSHVTFGEFYIQDYIDYIINDSTYIIDTDIHIPFFFRCFQTIE